MISGINLEQGYYLNDIRYTPDGQDRKEKSRYRRSVDITSIEQLKELWNNDKINTYQDIPLPDGTILKGWRHTSITWDLISHIDWKDKVVLEVGPFHGYFLIKISQAGAKECYGVDLDIGSIEPCYRTLIVAKEIIKLWKIKNIHFIKADWLFSPIRSKVDITLCFNTAWYFPDIEKGLRNIFSLNPSVMIFETRQHVGAIVDRLCEEYKYQIYHKIRGPWNRRPIRFCKKVE